MSIPAGQESNVSGKGRFATTHWSVVIAAGRSSSADSKHALASLCQSYWFPLYAYLRRQGYESHQAEDYLQGFFAKMLEKHYLKQVDRQRGKFRSFLLVSLKHFVANEKARDQAKKRGGGQTHLSLNLEDAENQYSMQTAEKLSAQKLYERSWALTLLERTLTRLREEWTQTKDPSQFEHLKIYLSAKKGSVPYREIAAQTKMTEQAIRVAVYRLRQRYRDLLRDEIAQTVTSEEQIEEEIRDLFAALA